MNVKFIQFNFLILVFYVFGCSSIKPEKEINVTLKNEVRVEFDCCENSDFLIGVRNISSRSIDIHDNFSADRVKGAAAEIAVRYCKTIDDCSKWIFLNSLFSNIVMPPLPLKKLNPNEIIFSNIKVSLDSLAVELFDNSTANGVFEYIQLKFILFRDSEQNLKHIYYSKFFNINRVGQASLTP